MQSLEHVLRTEKHNSVTNAGSRIGVGTTRSDIRRVTFTLHLIGHNVCI